MSFLAERRVGKIDNEGRVHRPRVHGRTDRPAATNVASLAQISFVAFLLGPPLLGYVAEHFGIRWSFGIGIPLVILSLVFAGALGAKPIRHEVD